MKDNTNNPLVVSEIAGIWNSYMNETVAVCVLNHFLNHIKDEEIKKILNKSLNLSQEHIENLKYFFNKEGISVPQGFTENDVNTNAPRLFTDSFYLFYLNTMASFAMDSYSLILRHCPRSDVRSYFSRCLIESLELTNETIDMLLSKGLFIKAPRLEVTKNVTFVEKKNFLSGILRTPRPLLAREATNIFSGLLIDIVINTLQIGFGQTAKIKEVREFMFKGKDFISQHYDEFMSLLSKEHIPTPSTYDTFVTDSIIHPFSEKLMMFHIIAVYTFGLSVDGAAIASSMRSDLTTIHTLFGVEIAKFISDGTDIMINNNWMEQPPQAINHEKLVST